MHNKILAYAYKCALLEDCDDSKQFPLKRNEFTKELWVLKKNVRCKEETDDEKRDMKIKWRQIKGINVSLKWYLGKWESEMTGNYHHYISSMYSAIALNDLMLTFHWLLDLPPPKLNYWFLSTWPISLEIKKKCVVFFTEWKLKNKTVLKHSKLKRSSFTQFDPSFPFRHCTILALITVFVFI